MTRTKNSFTWKIGGEAGFGIMATGAIFAKTCVRCGLFVVDYAEYPSLIRGGHNTYQATVASRQLWSHRRPVNILVALNRETIDRHLDELSHGAAVIYDTGDPSFHGFDQATVGRSDLHWHGLSLDELARRAGGQKLMRNTVALGATLALLSVDFAVPEAVVREVFAGKGESVVQTDVDVLRAGFEAVGAGATTAFPWDLEPLAGPRRMLISGNEAIGLGAIQAGCRFYAAYPMTPATSLLHFLAVAGPRYGMLVRHAEDELAVINETIGAAYAGARAMCGTSGGGFALMTEAVGLAGMAEVGIVVVEAQRGGPSTGLPTWTEQSDLQQVLHAGQGDFLKIVLAPADPVDCFTLTQEAFNLAERYQTPVIIMTDKLLAESHFTVEPFADSTALLDRGKIVSPGELSAGHPFHRYRRDVADGISPRTLPGTPHGTFLANSDEHDEEGLSNEDAVMRRAQMDRRARKTTNLTKHLPSLRRIGPKRSDLVIVTWGSTTGAVKETQRQLAERHGVSASIIQLTHLNPLPPGLADELRRANLRVIIEGNQSGQLESLMAERTGQTFDHHSRRYDGRPFDPDEITAQLYDLVR